MNILRLPVAVIAILLQSAPVSAAAFRLEVTLPAGAAKALEQIGRSLSLAIETELVENVNGRQTPLSQPKANLRSTERDGAAGIPWTGFGKSGRVRG
jgi:Mor family transcriptional regulator